MLDVKNLSNAILANEISLKRASNREFAKYLAIYRENIWFRDTWEKRIGIVDDSDHYFWLIQRNSCVGGVVLEETSFMSLFTIPPFNDEYILLEKIVKFLIGNSAKNEVINAYGILPSQAEHLLKLGFNPQKSRRCMIRPTEIFDDIQWEDNLKIVRPNNQYITDISKLFFENYDSLGFDGVNTLAEQFESVTRYFRDNSNEKLLNDASSIILDSNNDVIAACLISSWEGVPLVYDLAVSSVYRRSGLATKMLKHSLSTLKEKYDFVRLFVYSGNPAESVYYKLGFFSGTKTTNFCFSMDRKGVLSNST
ncbi:GNAT family N-acetyltransferase [Aureibacillus halotolerans]|uniref:Acetyltransferase (GNAT) family protein n=1 Tax=Aureibacillus halotolerans TaxID=1508390 RepID=A0A4R6TYW7_9BACI|nr:GNAT family N-acetyltransferase [Aureibacillus halotolerans]TDQ37155.1 acetyltransferase (GNAT) family protein [Aureibacillus halotolerans]